MNIIIAIGILAVFIGIVVILYIRRMAGREDVQLADKLTFDKVLDKVTKRLADMMKDDTFTGKDDKEFQRIYAERRRMEDAMVNCVYGIDVAKVTVKGYIKSIMKEIFPTQEDLAEVFDFDEASLNSHWMFEILLYRVYNKMKPGGTEKFKLDALGYIIEKYGWNKPKERLGPGIQNYSVRQSDLIQAYEGEVTSPLNFNEALDIATTLIYEKYKGMGIIDTLRTMNIDGYNFGTSGSILKPSTAKGEFGQVINTSADASVWVYYHGTYIHFQFLSFGTEEEVRRVVQLTARYNSPGPLTAKRGYLVNTMYDKSRVLALRPNASEYWAVFVRKFVLSSRTLEALIDPIKKDEAGDVVLDDDGNVVHIYNNAQLPQEMIKLLMRGQVTTGFTGRQGSGKTTMMVAAISQVDPRFNIRVLEMAPEMYLREIYTQRNILSVAETPTVDAAMLQDALKKSDAALSIVGEVATDVIAARMIQMGQVASIFTIFSHHANRTVDLVHALTNSIVAASGGSATPATVEPQVIDVIKVDCHLDYDVFGNRYIERITEIIRLDSQPYPERNEGESVEEYSVRLNKEYYTRQTDRQSFTTRDVLVFNPHTFTYDVARDKEGKPVFFTPELTKHIISRLPTADVAHWKDWINKYWFPETQKSKAAS